MFDSSTACLALSLAVILSSIPRICLGQEGRNEDASVSAGVWSQVKEHRELIGTWKVDRISGYHLLKISDQGFELEALEGDAIEHSQWIPAKTKPKAGHRVLLKSAGRGVTATVIQRPCPANQNTTVIAVDARRVNRPAGFSLAIGQAPLDDVLQVLFVQGELEELQRLAAQREGGGEFEAALEAWESMLQCLDSLNDAEALRHWQDRAGIVRSWRLIGPFPLSDDQTFDALLGPEGQGDSFGEWGGKERRWASHQSQNPFGRIKFHTRWGRLPNAVAYVSVTVACKKPAEAELRVQRDDDLQVFVDERRVLDQRGRSGLKWDAVRIPITLTRGRHTVVLKIRNLTGGWGVALRFCDSSGFGVPGLSVVTD